MWKWISPDGSSPATGAPGVQAETSNMSMTEISEQLAQTQQLVVQLKELIREKDNQLQSKEQQLKEDKDASDAKLSKAKLQNKAKVASLSSQLEELKKQIPASGTQQNKSDHKKSLSEDHENAAANRGKILVLRRKVEELESQVAQKNEELQTKITELERQRQRGSEMDAVLIQKEKKLSEKEAYIIELQMAIGSSSSPKDFPSSVENQKDQMTEKPSAYQDVETIIQNLTRKVGDNEEKYSLLQEQTESLKNLLNKEREHFQEREAMYVENIRVFQSIIQEKEKDLMGQAQSHEQELFKLAAKFDASADLEQLLKALKQKLHEKEEVLLGKTQVIDVLQKELDSKDQQIKEISERSKRLDLEKENLQSKLDAEKHVMRAQLRDMMDKHQSELKLVSEKHKAKVQEIQEKYETELQEKDHVLLNFQKQMEENSNLGHAAHTDATVTDRIRRLEAQVKLKTEEASKSESKFFKLKAWSKSRIKQLEEELKNSESKNSDMAAISEHISDLEKEKEQLQTRLQAMSELKTQNEELYAKLELYEEQQRKLQADLEQVTKRAASQTSESGSADELQNQALEWHDMIPESEETMDKLREEKSAMALRMVQIEEEREAIVSGQQELEEELASGQGMGSLPQAQRKGNQANKKPQGNYGYDSQRYEDPNNTVDSVDSTEGENMGGWWPEYTSPNAGLQTVVEELELERNQLQEQIMCLEERCQDLEDRLQLQVRIETLQVAYDVEEECQPVRFIQNDNERLQTQLMQLRAQFSREVELQQSLSASLNEQLKGLHDRKLFLETSLLEKEQKLLETIGKLEQMSTLRQSFGEQETLNKELSEKLVLNEQQLEEAKKKLLSCEMECAELKVTNLDIMDKFNTLKEKTSKQDHTLEIIQHELNQTNEELDRLNTSNLEERSQLIHDLQRCERENDNLKETIEERENELALLASNMTEYYDQLLVLKQQMHCKEEEIREIEDNLVKAQRENNLLRETQSLDVQESGLKISTLSGKLDDMELELNKTKDQNEAQTKESQEMIMQINEYTETIKELRSQIQTHTVVHRNHVVECEAQILLLKEQLCVSGAKLLESETKHKEEIDGLCTQLEENCSSKEKLNTLLVEKESNEQQFEKQLKYINDQNNHLISEAARKDDELAKLSKIVEEHVLLQETVKLLHQDKEESVKSLEGDLEATKQQRETMKLKFIDKLKAKEKKNRELERQIKDQSETIDELEKLNHDLQLTLEEKEVSLSDHIKTVFDLTKSMNILESKNQQLFNENESVLKILDEKKSEVLRLDNSVLELEKRLLINEEHVLDRQQTISLLRHDKEELTKKVEDLSLLCEQKDISISSELLLKTNECTILSKQVSTSKESIQSLQIEIQDLRVQLASTKEVALENEIALQNALTQSSTLNQQLHQNHGRIELFQKQVQELSADLDVKSKQLQENSIYFEENKCLISDLQNEIKSVKTENKKIIQLVEERESSLKQRDIDIEHLHKLNDKMAAEIIALNSKLEVQCKEIDKLKIENEDISIKLSNKSNTCESLGRQVTQNNSESVLLKQQFNMLDMENQKLKADIKITVTTLETKTEEITILSSHLSQQAHTILSLKDQIDSMYIEKEKMQNKVDEKEAMLAERETFIQEMNEMKLKEESQSFQLISDLQNQLHNVILETSQCKETIQKNENELCRQQQEIKLYKEKIEESELFKVQLSENVEVISDLHFQIKILNDKAEELNKLIVKKDDSLKEKINDYVNLRIKYSEMQEVSSMQQKQIETLFLEANQMETNISEQDTMCKNTLDYTEELKWKLQDKEIACESLRQQVKDLEAETLLLKQDVNSKTLELSDIKFSVAEKDNAIIEKEKLLRDLNDKISKQEIGNIQIEQQILLTSQLQSQIYNLENELKSYKELASEKENSYFKLQQQCNAHCEQVNQLSEQLGEKQDYIAALLLSLNEKDASVQIAEGNAFALTNENAKLREEIGKNAVALKDINSVIIQNKETISIKQQAINSLTFSIESLQMENSSHMEQINSLKGEIQQKELSVQSLQKQCLEQIHHIENLKSDIENLNTVSSHDVYDKTLLIETLQLEINNVVKEKNCLLEDIKMMAVENENLTVSLQQKLQQQSEELKDLHAKMENTLKDSEVKLITMTLQMKKEKEQLQEQVSTHIEEISALKLKVENLEVGVCESESKWKTEHGRVSQENALLKGQLNHLETGLVSRDKRIISLEQVMCMLDEQMDRCGLFSGEHMEEINVETLRADSLHTDNDTRLEKLSLVISLIEYKEKELNQLKEMLSIREKECAEIVDKYSKNQNLQSDFEIQKEFYESEIKHLLQKIESNNEAFYQQKSLLEKKEQMVSVLNTDVCLIQEQMVERIDELQHNSETLKTEREKILNLLEDIRKKEEIIEHLTSQTTQQKDFILALTHQLNEKDASISLVMESMPNEIVNVSKEKPTLKSRLDFMESAKSSSVLDMTQMSLNLEECHKELQHHKEMLAERDTQLGELTFEKDQVQDHLEKIRKEKDNIKKKLQASLVIRNDLLQKKEILEITGKDEIAKEQKKTEALLKTIDDLTHRLEVADLQKHEYESHLELLKHQLLMKDADVSNLNEVLAAKESLLEQCQRNIQVLDDDIVKPDDELQEFQKSVLEKDILFNQVQTDLDERERVFKRVHHLSSLEDFKSIEAKEDHQKAQCIETVFSAGDCCVHSKNVYSEVKPISLLEKENENLQEKQLASPFLGNKTMSKSQEEKGDNVNVFEKYNGKMKEPLQEEHALKDLHQLKFKDGGGNLKHISLQQAVKYCNALISENEVSMAPCKVDSDEKKNSLEKLFEEQRKAFDERVTELLSELSGREKQLDELHEKYVQVLQAENLLKENLGEKSVEISKKTEEIARLNYSLHLLEQQHMHDQEILITEIGHVQIKPKAISVEVDRINITSEQINPEQEAILTRESMKETQQETTHCQFAFEDLKKGTEASENVFENLRFGVDDLNPQTCHLHIQNQDLSANANRSEENVAVGDGIITFQRDHEKLQLVNLMYEIEMLKNNLSNKENCIQAQQDECSRKDRQIADLEKQIQRHATNQKDVSILNAEKNTFQHQDAKIGEENKSKEQLQKKLHAALISRKDVIKESKSLREENQSLILERNKLSETVSRLEHSLVELKEDTKNADVIFSLCQEKDFMVSENDRLVTENENLSAACESLKCTMETIVQEKEAFSIQLNSLQESMMVELSGWKAKHGELNKEYESLLQAYENISDEIDKMRQIIELTRKEKQELHHRFIELECKKQELEKEINCLHEENENQDVLIKSKKSEICELQSEVERLGCLIRSTTEDQSLLSKLTMENKLLLEENRKLNGISENIKRDLQTEQNEKDCLQINLLESKSNLKEQMELYKSEMHCKFDDICKARESLLSQVTSLTNEISEKEEHIITVEQGRNITVGQLKESEELLNQKNIVCCKLEQEVKNLKQHIISLNEKVRILEDDKCILQEELENIQENSDQIKYEKEFLETEILNNIKQVDNLTDALKSAQMQNCTLEEQLKDLKMGKCNVQEKMQQLQRLREFEEKVKEASREHSGAKYKSKELQELLKEKQLEILQLQKDSIQFQELILDLERTVKLYQSNGDKYQQDLNITAAALNKSREDGQILNEKLNSYMSLLDGAKSEIASLTSKNIKLQGELKHYEDNFKLQIENKQKYSNEELKMDNMELSAFQNSYDTLRKENDRLVEKLHEMKNDLGTKDLTIKTLQSELNMNMARAAAFSQCISLLENNKAIDEMKIWEKQFKDSIQNKESQIEGSNHKIILLQDIVKEKMAQIKELEIRCYLLQEHRHRVSLQTHTNTQLSQEIADVQENNSVSVCTLTKLDRSAQTKEDSLQAEISKNHSFICPTSKGTDLLKEKEILSDRFTQKEQEYKCGSSENNEVDASFHKQMSSVAQCNVMLKGTDLDRSMLFSSKCEDVSNVLSQIQTEYRKPNEELENQASGLQTEGDHSHEAILRMENELQSLSVKAEKVSQEKSELANRIEDLKKSLATLRSDGHCNLEELNVGEESYKGLNKQNRSTVIEHMVKNIDLKQEVRNLLNEIDDLHSENAMLRAQLLRYREDLIQVLSLKDHQLKELLKQQLDRIKNLEQENCNLQKEHNEAQRLNILLKEKIQVLELENGKVLSKTKNLEFLIATLNKERLVSESKEQIKKRHIDGCDPKTSSFKMQAQDKNGKIPQLADDHKDEDKLSKLFTSQHNADTVEHGMVTVDKIKEEWMMEFKNQNADLKSENNSLAKAMAALQNDRDRLIEEFKMLQCKYVSELKFEQIRGDNLDFKLNDLESRLSKLMYNNNFGEVFAGDDKDTLDHLGIAIKNLCQTLATRDLEIARMSTESRNYTQQIDAFAKAMGSLQDDRDRLLQQIRNVKSFYEMKQGSKSLDVSSDTSSNRKCAFYNDEKKLGQESTGLTPLESVQLKSNIDDLERALQKAKALQERTDHDVSSYKAELAKLRSERNLLITEARALRDQCSRIIAEKDCKIAELQKFHQEITGKESTQITNVYELKAMETSVLVGNVNIPDQVKQLLAEKSQLQNEMQRCLQEMHQREQKRNVGDEVRAEVPPGAPQERASVIVEIDNMELSDLRKRLVEIEHQYGSSKQQIALLTEKLEEEKDRREAAEEALRIAEKQDKRADLNRFGPVPREYEYSLQMESDDEREALIIDPREHVVVRKMKGGALSIRRWLRGRSIYCSKLLTSRSKSRYLFLTYLLTLHMIVVMCFAGVI
ncbi:golgin subfamily B member 1-like isoform X2 [Ambystoma mexicanum]|uniref:golgin subfamily B member 1-like isoform X2 n=1 Tax=Ambystoma mexicanum TaxID=8296 RepID=UPI0037E89600